MDGNDSPVSLIAASGIELRTTESRTSHGQECSRLSSIRLELPDRWTLIYSHYRRTWPRGVAPAPPLIERQQFADNPWVQQVLANMVDLAHERDTARFSKEAMFSSRRMNSRLSAKEEAVSMLQEGDIPAFLRRKAAQGKAQYRRGPEDNDPSSKN